MAIEGSRLFFKNRIIRRFSNNNAACQCHNLESLLVVCSMDDLKKESDAEGNELKSIIFCQISIKREQRNGVALWQRTGNNSQDVELCDGY